MRPVRDGAIRVVQVGAIRPYGYFIFSLLRFLVILSMNNCMVWFVLLFRTQFDVLFGFYFGCWF